MSLNRHESDVDQLAAPAEDGGMLVWPAPDRIAELISANQRLREQSKGRLQPSRNGALPILVGHQPEMMHPGVWIKFAAATRLARATGRDARFVCVDHDLTNGIPLNVPIRHDNRWKTHTFKLGSSGMHSFEQEPPRSTSDWAALFDEAGIPPGNSAWGVFKDAFLGGDDNETKVDYVARWLRGMNALLTACGEAPISIVRIQDVFLPSAPAPENRSFAFVGCLLSQASAFFDAYNRALAAYRKQRGIRGDAHPIPDLVNPDGRIETPFWAVRDDQPRCRLYVGPVESGRIALFADTTPVCSVDSRSLVDEPHAALTNSLGAWRIRPRALSLTMYLRLFECDLFIHGIGGAKYDVITDAIMRDFLGVEPPGYACVSATARLALDNPAQSGAVNGVAAARNRLRSARFNPQRLIPQANATGEIAIALADREAGIGEARNLRETAPNDHVARRTAFQRIRNANQRIASLCPQLMQEAERALDMALQSADDRMVTHSREWFTGLYSLDQLRALCARLPW